MIVPLIALAALHVRPDHQAASRSERREPIVHDWSGVARCESGGAWHINTGNGFYGGLQFTAQTFAAFGGHGRADLASTAGQIRVAERVLAVQGPGAWPRCGVYLRGAA